MALLFMDSFDHYVTADLLEKYVEVSSWTIVAAIGRNSTAGARGNSNARYCTRGITTTSTTVIAGLAVKLTAFTTGVLSIGESGTPHVFVWAATDGSLSVYRFAGVAGWVSALGASVLLTTTGPGVIALGSYNHIQLKVTIHDTTGYAELRVNGVVVGTPFTGDTRNSSGSSGTGIPTMVQIGGAVDADDFYICDGLGAAPWNDFLGDCRVDARYPTAEGTTTDWTPLSGTNNALMVDDPGPPYTPGGALDDDTTYNSTSTVNAIDTFVVQDAPVVGATIYGIQHCLSVKKMDAGTASLAPVIRHGTTNYPGTSFSPGTGYVFTTQVAQTNPGTAAQWTEADFNAAEFGYKRTS